MVRKSKQGYKLVKSLFGKEIKIPENWEQQKITSIISKVDDKLNDLESKKTNLEILKKGLMQKLLTGKIRVMA